MICNRRDSNKIDCSSIFISLYIFLVLILHQLSSENVDCQDWNDCLPFNRTLKLTSPELTGPDIVILQNLLKRHPNIILTSTGIFDIKTKIALQTFQQDLKLPSTDGVLDIKTAGLILNNLMSDGYKDNQEDIPKDAKFKIYIPVYRDRTIETTGILYGPNGDVLYKFTSRTRGGMGHKALNQLTTNGDTPTGLIHVDINTKEPDPKSFGPYPIVRLVKGIHGNSAIGRDNYTGIDGPDTFLSDYRNGILIHTGQWANWTKDKPMPNSHGCIHVSPDDQKMIIDLLISKCGCHVNENPFLKVPYPYKPQGIISIEQLD